MKHLKGISLLLLLFLFTAISTGCTPDDAAGNNESGKAQDNQAEILEQAAAWFQRQTSQYEIICSEVCNDTVVFLTGTKNPGTNSYQLLQAFVVKRDHNGYAVIAMKDGERAISAGISAHILTADGLTVVFGDTGDSVFDFINDRRINVDFTEIRLLLKNNTAISHCITGGEPYLLVFPEPLEIIDIEFISGDLIVSYSTFYGDKLMENTASYDVSGIFE